jgi:uncharacterized membrane protein YjgN (DUF898 family)
MRWESEHTIIEGKHLTFDGKASQLFGKYLLWMLLSVITVGLYYIFAMQTNLIRWQTKHTHFEGENGESKFTGTALGYLGVRLLIIVISICTLFIGSFWASCYKNRWITSRKIIDGQQLLFNGKAMQYFGKRIVWLLLTLITIGIYSFWLKVKSKKWLTSHIKIATEEELQAELAMQDVNNYKAFCVLGLILAIIFRVIYMIVIIKMFNSIDDDTETFIPILSTIGFSLRCTIIPLIVNIIAVSMGSKRAKNGRSVKGKGFAIAGIIIAIL